MVLNVVRFLLIIVEVMTALLLISVILVQRSKSQGMGLAFGSGMGESLFGAQMGNVITRITVILAIVFLANTTLLAVIQSGNVDPVSVTDNVTPPPVVPMSQIPSQQPLQATGEGVTPAASPLEATVPASLPETDAAATTDMPAPAETIAVDIPAETVNVAVPPVTENVSTN